jgi:hypothetical protein
VRLRTIRADAIIQDGVFGVVSVLTQEFVVAMESKSGDDVRAIVATEAEAIVLRFFVSTPGE